jgi:GH43 family beta-xylosidase
MKPLTLLILFFFTRTGLSAQEIPPVNDGFSNPLLPSGADPYSIYKDGYYYYTQTMQNRLVIWKTKSLANLKTADKKTIWLAKPHDMNSIWAPELHYLNGKWYMYFAAVKGGGRAHRMYVLENSAKDPLEGNWLMKGKVSDPSDKWAIDGNVFKHKGTLYMMWSGWEGDVNVQQNIYIAKMKNPWTITGSRVKISGADYDWEKHGDLGSSAQPPHVTVNEGPQILFKDKKMFVIYSASGCWTDFYALGMLSANAAADPMNPGSWTKSPEPVFKQSPENGVYAPGHNSFFKSPDGKEDWILYHANSGPGLGCGSYRSPRAQKFSWQADGTPNFGIPLKTDVK